MAEPSGGDEVAIFVLVHSPLVGPSSWQPVSAELSLLEIEALVPDLATTGEDQGPHWRKHAGAVQSATAAILETTVLVAHSGAGPLLPVIAWMSHKRPLGYIFVDAALPDALHPRKGDGGFAKKLDDLHARGRLYPDWTEEDLRSLVPDESTRRLLLAEVRPQPAEFWEEVIPVPDSWPDAPCGYLRFSPNPAYEAAAAEALRRGWPLRDLPGSHFHLVVESKEVARSLVAIARDIGCMP